MLKRFCADKSAKPGGGGSGNSSGAVRGDTSSVLGKRGGSAAMLSGLEVR